MLGFIEQNPDSLAAGGRRLMTPASYMHPLRGRYNYDTYQSVPADRYYYYNYYPTNTTL